MYLLKCFCASVVLSLFVSPCFAAELYVDDDAGNDPGPGDPAVSDLLEDGTAAHPFDAIQEALDAAAPNDDVVVLNGTYSGAGNYDIDFHGKGVRLTSDGGPEACVIDCEGRWGRRGFYLHSGEASNAVIEGFTVTGGWATANSVPEGVGGGIYCGNGANPTIRANVITANRADQAGGGLYCENASPTILDNVISLNGVHEYSSGGEGGGICCRGSASLIAGNTIVENRVPAGYRLAGMTGGGAGICATASNLTILNNTIAKNSAFFGGGIACYGTSNLEVRNNFIVENGLVGIHCELPSRAEISNCTIVGNWDAGIHDWTGATQITNCIIWGNAIDLSGCSASFSCIQDANDGQGNISVYPHFADRPAGDFHLKSGSPCIDAGTNGAVSPGDVDIDGEQRIQLASVDIGADEVGRKSSDNDNDGLPDAWEIEYLGGTGSDGSDNGDGDELDNFSEFRLGTDPTVDNRTVYVSAANAGDAAADGTAEHPFAHLQDAVNIATQRVLVAEGTYLGHVIVDGKALDIEGGYSGNFGERNLHAHLTTLDAEKTARPVMIAGAKGGSFSGFTITGGHTLGGGGVWLSHGATTTIANNIITGNSAVWGGGIECGFVCQPLIIDNLITGNKAEVSGGGVWCWQSSATLINNTIAGNVTNQGGGIQCKQAAAKIRNCILWDNSAGEGPEIALAVGSSLSVSYCDIAGGQASAFRDFGSTLNWITGNVVTNPMFVAPGAWNEYGTPDDFSDDFWVRGDYHLDEASPCIDRGDPGFLPAEGETDLDGLQRVEYGRVDIGAYEKHPSLIDLAPAGLEAPSAVQAGSTITIRWEVVNNGPGAADDFTWSDELLLSWNQLYEPTDRRVAYVAATGHAPLGPGDDYALEAEITVPEDIDPVGRWHIIIRTDCDGGVEESDEENNTAVRPIRITWPGQVGDVNNDDCVNVTDLLQVRAYLGVPASRVRREDVNADGTCNIADLLRVRSHLGLGGGCPQ